MFRDGAIWQVIAHLTANSLGEGPMYRKIGLAALIGSVFSASGYAVELQQTGVPVGNGAHAYFKLGINNRYDDNIFNARVNETESWITSLTPEVKLESKRAMDVYSLTYNGDIGAYHESSRDDYDDHTFTASMHKEFNYRNRLDVTAQYQMEHDERGTGRTEGGGGVGNQNPDEYDVAGIHALYGFGGMESKGRVDLEAGYSEKEYQNNRAATRARDLDTTDAGATFYLRVAPKTSLLLQAKHTDLDYVSANTLDSDENRVLVGVTWNATAKTTGVIKYGYLEKEFDSAARNDYSGDGWEVDITWNPRSYSAFNFTAGRSTNETDGTGDYILNTDVAIAWGHNWSHRLSSNLYASYANKEFEASTREDDLTGVGASLGYLITRRLRVDAGVDYTDNDSNLAANDYDKNTYFVNLTAVY